MAGDYENLADVFFDATSKFFIWIEEDGHEPFVMIKERSFLLPRYMPIGEVFRVVLGSDLQEQLPDATQDKIRKRASAEEIVMLAHPDARTSALLLLRWTEAKKKAVAKERVTRNQRM